MPIAFAGLKLHGRTQRGLLLQQWGLPNTQCSVHLDAGRIAIFLTQENDGGGDVERYFNSLDRKDRSVEMQGKKPGPTDLLTYEKNRRLTTAQQVQDEVGVFYRVHIGDEWMYLGPAEIERVPLEGLAVAFRLKLDHDIPKSL